MTMIMMLPQKMENRFLFASFFSRAECDCFMLIFGMQNHGNHDIRTTSGDGK